MKKPVKRILLGIVILISIVILFFVVLLVKMRSELKGMKPTETKEIIKNMYAVNNGYVSFHLIREGDTYVAVDAGNDLDVVAEELKKLNIDPSKVVAVLLTHTDRDHVGALKLFKNAQIYLSIEEEKMINGEESKFLLMSNSIDSKEYRLVRDGDSLNFNGIKVKCILTPGHTSGSTSWLINDKYLFTGDAISLKNGKIGKPIDFFTMDPEMALKSIEKITTIPGAEYIFTSHNGYTDDYKNAVKDWKPKK